MTSLSLPNRTGSGPAESVELTSHLVITGANGSGKTRLGVWIEENHQHHRPTHRISAQKALAIPEFAQLKNL